MAGNRKDELTQDTTWASDPWTGVKHLLYRNYVNCWMPVILQTKWFGGGAIVDAFAGPGTYKDGADGSPVLFAKAFRDHQARQAFQPLDLYAVEERADRVDELRRQVNGLPSVPGLTTHIHDPSPFADALDGVHSDAHAGGNRPVLWVLDPYGVKPVPFEMIERCLASPKDELLLTFFVYDMNRWCNTPEWELILNAHFGSPIAWRNAAQQPAGPTRVAAFVDAYRRQLESRCHVLTSTFGIRISRHTARYYVIYATHHPAGLKCFVPAKWRLDAFAGEGASGAPDGSEQLDMFLDPDLSGLERAMRDFRGTAVGWSDLVRRALLLGFKEPHVRRVLDTLAREGLVVRETVASSLTSAERKRATSWPDGCVVRFYDPALVQAGESETP